MKKIRIGFIGNGKSTNRYHAPFILSLPEKFEIAKIFSRNHARDAWSEIDGTAYVSDVQDILEDPRIELVVITTPPDSHHEYAKLALEAGKNVLVEKPFTASSDEARELFALAGTKGLMLQGYQNRRFDSDFLTLKKVLDSGKLGTLTEIESHYDYYRPEIPEQEKEYDRLRSFVYGHGCHTLDQMIALLGTPERTVFDVRSLLGPGRMNDYFDIDLFYKEPLKVSVKSGYFRVKSRPKFVAWGTRGMFVKETEDRQEQDLKHFRFPKDHPDFGKDRPEDYGTLIWHDDSGKYHEEKVVTESGSYARFYEKLFDTLRAGAEPEVKPEETLALMELLEQAAESLERRMTSEG